MSKVILFVLLTGVSMISFSQNLVVNPGFELWEKANKPAGWTTAQNCLKDSASIMSGKYSCRHDGGTKYLGQLLPVVRGKQYNLTFFYRTIITGTGNGCRIWCYFKDEQGNNLADPATDDILRPSKYLKNDIWQQFSVVFPTPQGATSFYLEIRTYQNSTAFFDDFTLEEIVSAYVPEKRFSEIKIYPNPSVSDITIGNVFNLRQVCIQNLSGTTLWSSGYNGELTVTIPVSELPDGLYIVRIITSEGVILRKFIKHRY
jgi:hypothetical protein